MPYFKNIPAIMVFTFLITVHLFAQKLDSDLLKAARKGKIDRVEQLLRQGVSIDATDNKGRTPLMLAAEKGRIEVVRLLLDHGADIEAKDNNGQSALAKARKKRKKDVIRLLAFESAKRLNTIESFIAFIDEFQNGQLLDSARATLCEMLWQKAIADSTAEICNSYFVYCPDGKNTESAKELEKSIEVAYYKRAAASTSVDDCENYLKYFPKGIYASEMQELLEESAFQVAKKLNTVAAYDDYLEKNPDGKFSTEAQVCFLKASDRYNIPKKERARRERLAKEKLQLLYKDLIKGEDIYKYITFKKNYYDLLSSWSLQREFRDKFDEFREEKISKEYEAAKRQNTLAAYHGFKEKFAGFFSWSIQSDMENRIKAIYQMKADVDLEKIRQENTVEAFEAFNEKYEDKLSYEQQAEVRNYLQALYYDCASSANDSTEFIAYLEKFPSGEYAKKARAKLLFFKNQVLVQSVLRAENEQARLAVFKKYLKKSFAGNVFNYSTMREFVVALRVGIEEEKQKLPYSTGSGSFFDFFSSFKYIPLVTGELGYQKFDGDRMDLLRSLAEFMVIYSKDEYTFETVYLANNIARMAALNSAEKGHAYFDNLTIKDIQRAQISRLSLNMKQAISSGDLYSFQYESKKRTAEMEASRNLYSTTAFVMISLLHEKKLDGKTKKYILKNLPNWARLVAFSEEDVSKLKQISKTDKDPKNRRLALKTIKNIKSYQ